MASYMWRKYADYVYTKWERMVLWNMVEPYTRSKSFTPLITIYVAAFYTGVVASAITEQLYKEKYWEDHPGHQSSPSYEAKVLWRTLEGRERRGSSLSPTPIDKFEKLLRRF